MNTRIIPFDYEGQTIRFNTEGWFNATEVAEWFRKRLDHWLDNAETLNYVRALDELQHPDAGPSVISNPRKSGYLKTRRGNTGGTWLHPKLAVVFARWCNAKFAVWCDLKIDALLRGGSKSWTSARREASIGYRGMCDAVVLNCKAQGKTPQPYHFINEARLINEIITGAFTGRNRDYLSAGELELVTMVEIHDVMLIGQGLSFTERKTALRQYVQEQQRKHLQKITGRALLR